jgi:hypothetical protein
VANVANWQLDASVIVAIDFGLISLHRLDEMLDNVHLPHDRHCRETLDTVAVEALVVHNLIVLLVRQLCVASGREIEVYEDGEHMTQ